MCVRVTLLKKICQNSFCLLVWKDVENLKRFRGQDRNGGVFFHWYIFARDGKTYRVEMTKKKTDLDSFARFINLQKPERPCRPRRHLNDVCHVWCLQVILRVFSSHWRIFMAVSSALRSARNMLRCLIGLLRWSVRHGPLDLKRASICNAFRTVCYVNYSSA